MKIDFSMPLLMKNGKPFFKVEEGKQVNYTLGTIVSEVCSFIGQDETSMTNALKYQLGKWANELEDAGEVELSIDDVKKIKDRIQARVTNVKMASIIVDVLDPKPTAIRAVP